MIKIILYEKCSKDSKGVIRSSRHSKKDKQFNDKKKEKQGSTNTTENERLKEPYNKTRGKLPFSGKLTNSCSNNDTLRVTYKQYEHHVIWKS